MAKEGIIDLEKFKAPAAKVLTGRPFGRVVRIDSRIDEIESKSEVVKVIIPEGLFTIGPSFFEELFKNVIRKLGKDDFYRKFSFENRGDYPYEVPLTEAVERVLRDKTALDR